MNYKIIDEWYTYGELYDMLEENPYVRGTKPSMDKSHGISCKCGKCNEWGYVKKSDDEILQNEKHIQQWKISLFRKKAKLFPIIQHYYFIKIRTAYKNALIMNSILNNKERLETWL